MHANEVILEVLAEGGSRALYGLRRPDGWLFSLDFIEFGYLTGASRTASFAAKTVDTFSDALVLLDQYHWIKLSPSMVHPEFREEVLSAVISREETSKEQSKYHDKWVEKCEPLNGDPSNYNRKRYEVHGSISTSDSWMYENLD